MDVIIVYALEPAALLPHTLHRPPALLPLAGSSVLGHVVNQLRDLPAARLTMVAPAAQQTAVSQWLSTTLPEQDVQVVACAEDANFVQAAAQCRDALGADAALLLPGEVIVEADFAQLSGLAANAAGWVCENSDVAQPARVALSADRDAITAVSASAAWAYTGLLWFRHGTELRALLATAVAANAATPAELLAHALEQGPCVAAQPAFLHVAVDSQANWLAANARLLGLGYGTQDAIERSYVEDFTVIPPVFIHPTATIENAVIGPFVNVAAGATVRSSVLRNTLVGAETAVTDAVLDGAIIGRACEVNGRAYAVQVGDEAIVELA